MRSIPEIPEAYRRFPSKYVNDIRGWGFDRHTIQENVGRLLTLDLDFGSTCSLNCPSCFRKNNSVDQRSERTLGFADLVRVVREAKVLGLRSVKFLGAGDPFETHGFLEFLRFLNDEGVIPLVFTKGHVIGDDCAVEKLFGYLGISTSEGLVDALYDCQTSIMLGCNSFDDQLQARLVGAPKEYLRKRNRALALLVDRGFAKHTPTRLALAVNPVTKANISEAFDIYRWARLRNLYAIVTPTMISGRAQKTGTWRAITPSFEELLTLYTKIYQFNLATGLQTMEQILEEGISAYAGGHPCNQVSTGLYVTLGGTVLSCPGSETSIEGSVWEATIGEIWANSKNRLRSGTYNCGCIAKDGKSIPEGLYQAVMRSLSKVRTAEAVA